MSAGAITLNEVRSADWSLALERRGGIGQVVEGIDDVSQCIEIILTTPKGSDPLRPTFGADLWQFIDYPINAAIPAIVRELTEAITLWEPRVKLIAIKAGVVRDGAQAGAQLLISITWELKLGGAAAPAQTTVVTIPGGLA